MKINIPWTRNKFLERKVQVLEENYHLLSEVYRKNERLYHDMNHHLQMIYYIAQKSQNTEITDYVTSVSEPINQMSDLIWSGVDIVDAIINHTFLEAREKGIQMDVNVEFPGNSNIAPDDLCVILFNLLDNAMEACERLLEKQKYEMGTEDKPLISVTIRRIQQFLVIKVQNPLQQSPKRHFGWFLSTKNNSVHHGIGLKNVRETTEKYGGNIEFEVKDKMFITSVLLFFEEKSEMTKKQ